MDQSQKIILTPFNFFEWKAEMEILLRVKCLYRLTMEIEVEPNTAAEKIKWHNRRDEAYGLLCLSISLSPNSFESLQLYFSKFKALVLQLKQCGRMIS